MARSNALLNAFNRGIISDLALARTDIERLSLSATIMTNFLPRALGSMSLRPGLKHITGTKSDQVSLSIPFKFSTSDQAIIELTDNNARFIISDAVLSRPTVSTTITNGSFTSNITGWTDNDEAGATSVWAAGGYLAMTGSSSTQARVTQALTVSGGDQGDVHSLAVEVHSGIITIRVGTSSGSNEFLDATELGAGLHNLAFIPTAGTVYLDISCSTEYTSKVASVVMGSSGEVNITTPWGEEDLPNIRWDQSGDVIYCDCQGVKPYKIERRTNNSWSIVQYKPIDGPFRNVNATQITLATSGINGDITVTASGRLFASTHVGALFYHDSVGQLVSESISAHDTYSDAIRVTGSSSARHVTITRSGTWTATLTLQRSVGSVGAWVDVTTYTTNGTVNYDDNLDDQIIYYRIGVKSGDYTSGTVVVSLNYSNGSITGVFEITAVTSSLLADARVLKSLGGTDATRDWGEGSWSGYRGYPSSVALHDGRLWHAGKGSIYGSISDTYESFDPDYVGNAGPINRSIGYGPIDNINWLLATNQLFFGTDGAVINARSTSFEEPLTPTNFNLRTVSTQGASNIAPVLLDKKGVYVQSGGTRVFEIDIDATGTSYQDTDLTILAPEIGEPAIVKLLVQRQPDTRVHCLRSDGTVAIIVYDKAENVKCWFEYETDGFVEDGVVLTGAIEDSVYYTVRRVIDGDTKRFHEKFAKESECSGLPDARLADCFVEYSGAAVTTITGLSHLEGKEVVVWGWNTITPFEDNFGNTIGKDLGEFTVTSGQITGLASAVTNACIGLGYTGQYQSSKLAYGANFTAIAQKKKVTQLALVLKNTHIGGIKFGRDFGNLRSLNKLVKGQDAGDDAILINYDHDALGFGGVYDTDSRLCLQAAAPRPATVLACVVGVEVHEKV